MERSCVDCSAVSCDDTGKRRPEFCPSKKLQKLAEVSIKRYHADVIAGEVMHAASDVEFEYYGKMTRIEEIAEFAEKLGVTKIGIATCAGLIREACLAAKFFRYKTFEVYGISCKCGEVSNAVMGIDESHDIHGTHICNPIMQALALNDKGTELNVVMGLCVGHDSLFYRYSKALCTTLVVKDRVLGHNPAVALYQMDSYYSKLMK